MGLCAGGALLSHLLPQASNTPLSVARASSDTPADTLRALRPLRLALLDRRTGEELERLFQRCTGKAEGDPRQNQTERQRRANLR